MSKLTKKNVKKSLKLTGGMPTHAAKLLGVSYSALHSFINKNPEFKEIKEGFRAKLHGDLESLSVFAIKTGYLQRFVLDEKGNPTSEIKYDEVDVQTRLNMAKHIMSIYKSSTGIKDEIDVTSKNKALKGGGITIIELPEILRKSSDI